MSKRKIVPSAVVVDISCVKIIHLDCSPLAAIVIINDVLCIDIDLASRYISVGQDYFRKDRYIPVVIDKCEYRFLALGKLLQQINYNILSDADWNSISLYSDIARYWNHLLTLGSRISILDFCLCGALVFRQHML